MTKRLTVFLLAALLLCTALLSSCEEEDGTNEGEGLSSVDILFMVDNEIYARFSEGGIPADPEKQGFRFDGWYFDKGVWQEKFELSTSLNQHYVISGEAGSILSGIDNIETFSYSFPSSIMIQSDKGEDVCVWAKFTELPPEGYTTGKLCYAQEVPLFGDDGKTFNVSDAKKVTVINFWGTWCPPCVGELPHFDELAREYGDRITMVAIHSQNKVADAPAYIAEYFADSPILFGYDVYDSYFLRLGGYAYPMTLVLDENGVVVANHTGALEKEQLQALIEQAFGETETAE